MGTVRTLKLPAPVSPCLRFFIEMLFEEVDGEHAASWHQNHDLQSALPKAIQTEETLANEVFR